MMANVGLTCLISLGITLSYILRAAASGCPPLISETVQINCSLAEEEVDCSKRMPIATTAVLACKPGFVEQSSINYLKITCRKGNMWSREVYNCIPDCGRRNRNGLTELVSLGNYSKVAEFPWHVLIYKTYDRRRQICGGSLISPNVVISAAHCIWGSRNGSAYPAREFKMAAGKLSRSWEGGDSGVQRRDVEQVIPHQLYRGLGTNFVADIVLLKPVTPFHINARVNVICIDWNNQFLYNQLVEGNLGVVPSWRYADNKSDEGILKYIDIPFVSPVTCLDSLEPESQKVWSTDRICAGFVNKSMGVCAGDSGGGLVFLNPGTDKYYLRGVVSIAFSLQSHFNNCYSQHYTGFTKFSEYTLWLQENGVPIGDLPTSTSIQEVYKQELPTSTSIPEAKATNSVTVLVTITIVATVVASIVLLLLILVLVTKKRQERKLRDELMLIFEGGVAESFNPRLPLDEQADLLPYSKRWEFPRDRLKLGEQLGAGAFGVVLKGEAVCIQGGEAITTVAVKMVKRNAGLTHIKNLASELKIMAHLGQHLNVVNFLGACTKNLDKRDLLVIVEFCRYGNLHNYLLRHRADFIDQIDPNTGLIDPTVGTDVIDVFKIKERQASLDLTASSGRDDLVVKYQPSGNEGLHLDTTPSLTGLKNAASQLTPTINSNRVAPAGSDFNVVFEQKECPICTKDLLSWAFQVARGMEYLSERKVLHGDLAARNILLADDNVVKICDFGLSKTVYSSSNYLKKGNERLPLKWMAIESIQDGIFSIQSDVWSYGIVLWEFFSLGRTPYPGMETYDELYRKLQTGYRMEKPEHGTEEVHAVMQRCWEAEPSVRPSFTDLVELVGDMLEESVRAHYVDLNEPYDTMNRLSRADEGDYPNLGRTSSGGETEVTGGGEG